jgi:hypothetical protein
MVKTGFVGLVSGWEGTEHRPAVDVPADQPQLSSMYRFVEATSGSVPLVQLLLVGAVSAAICGRRRLLRLLLTLSTDDT